MINPGKYKHRIKIIKLSEVEDSAGFIQKEEKTVLTTYAEVKTTKGYTLIKNDTDFEHANTNFTIRYPKIEITRDMLVEFNSKRYTIEYLNNINEGNIELEIQARVVMK